MDEVATQDISLDALIYFATHSLLIVSVAAGVFFFMGLWVGWLTWAKYKRRARAYSEELQIQRREIANLKRRIAEETVVPDADSSPPELTPLLSEPLFEAAKNPIAAAVEQRNEKEDSETEPEPEPMTVGKAETPRQTSLAEAIHLPPRKPPQAEVAETGDKRGAPDNKSKPQVKLLAPAANVEFPAPEPVALPLQLPEIPVLRSAAGRAVTRALARSTDEARTAPLLGGVADESVAQSAAADEATALAEGKARRDEKLGLIYLSKPDRHDDLTLLRGVGEGLSSKLQEQGIYTFKQIALWTEDQVTEFDHRLLTKDRIRREHWVKQARNLHFLKYGEELKPAVEKVEG